MENKNMWVVMLEACVAFFLLVFIVWWTMYADRPAPKKPAPRVAGAEEKPGASSATNALPASPPEAGSQAAPRD